MSVAEREIAGTETLAESAAKSAAGAKTRAETAAPAAANSTELAVTEAPVVVIGGGPSGLRVAEELARRGKAVTVLNAERWQPYNRVKLTPFMAGEVQIGQVFQPLTFPEDAPVKVYTAQRVTAIDRDAKTVVTRLGRRFPYSSLVICTGSRAHVPGIPGRELSGVYTFRNFDDVEALTARLLRARRAAVIGGGLLGLEAARGLAARKIETTVIEHLPHLMVRQLNDSGGALLARQIRKLGVAVETGIAVKAIEGSDRVESLVLNNGERLSVDTVIVCTGIRPNIELARDAGLPVHDGIRVDDQLRTVDPSIFAVGECAEHDGHVYGLVSPCLEQAKVCAAAIAGETLSYRGSLPSTKLKVVGVDVFSMGDVEQLEDRPDIETLAWRGSGQGADEDEIYRLLAFRRGRLVGGLGVGAWPEVNRLQQAIRDQARFGPLQRRRFRCEGRLYGEAKVQSVRDWPASATVCNCTGVSRGQLGAAIAQGCGSVEALRLETGASSVCGSCKPDLESLLSIPATREAVKGAPVIALFSIVVAFAGLAAFLLPAWPFSDSVQTGQRLDRLWTDGFLKQVSGFTLLGISGFAAFLSIRKRIVATWLGGYEVWRILHVGVGALGLLVLFLHSGFNLGSNLNLALMLSFLGLLLIGAAAGGITALAHRFGQDTAAARRSLIWLHILAFWPLPLLLSVHIASSYAY